MSHNFIIGPTDTDSISFCKEDGSPMTKLERATLLLEINNMSPELIVWEDDGYYPVVLALKAKNYVLLTEDNAIKIRGSGLKASQKEPILKEMQDKIINCLLFDKQNEILDVYIYYIKEALNVIDITKWSSKKTVTKAVLDCKTNFEARTNEKKIYDAVKDDNIQEGDKIYLYPAVLSSSEEVVVHKNGKTKNKIIQELGLKQSKNWNNDHNVDKLVERVYATMEIFANVLDMSTYVDYTLVKNKKLLTSF
jgi:hypothetical protein